MAQTLRGVKNNRLFPACGIGEIALDYNGGILKFAKKNH